MPALEFLLKEYAEKYETAEFINGDPSWFMHQVEGDKNKEAIAFIASCLSYGSRKQFLPKIESILNLTNGFVDEWLRNKDYLDFFRNDDNSCFYRLYTHADMFNLFNAYNKLICEHKSLGDFLRKNANDGMSAVENICRFFNSNNVRLIVPKDTTSACKRICMFLRWMVRDNSPVDIGLWADFIDKKTLIMPLDTHVVSQSVRLGLLKSKSSSMKTAIKLTKSLSDIFPEDPLKGDFALFGYGVNHDNK